MKKKWIFFFVVLASNLIFSGTFRPEPGKPVEIKAGRAVYKWEIKKLLLENSNRILPSINYGNSTLISDLMIYDDNLKKGFAYGNVHYEDKKERVIVNAQEAIYDEATKEITLSRNPTIIMKKDGTFAKSDRIKIYPEKDLVYLIGNVSISNTNFLINGKQAEMNRGKNQFIIKDDVVVTQKETKLYAKRATLDSSSKANSYTASGGVKVEDLKEGYTIFADRLDYFKEEGYMRITGGYPSLYSRPTIKFTNREAVVSSTVMEKFDKEEKANLLGDVEITQGERKVFSKWGEYFIKEKKVILTGSPVLQDGTSKFYSYRITVDVDKQTVSMRGKGKGKYLLKNQ